MEALYIIRTVTEHHETDRKLILNKLSGGGLPEHQPDKYGGGIGLTGYDRQGFGIRHDHNR
jgi:hypothetical protein